MMRIHAEVHISSKQKAAKVDNVRRPVISAGGTSEEWSYFNTRWTEYKMATKITGIDKVIQLLECCEEDLRKNLSRASGGTLTNMSEEEVLEKIKVLAVRRENIMVARVELHEMSQQQGEDIRSFSCRVKGQADVCKFLMDCPTCSNTVSFTDEILKYVIVNGVYDSDIQLDLLSENRAEMSLEDILRYVEAKESGKRSHPKMSHNVQTASSSRSQYQRSKFQVTSPDAKCSFCGTTGHGKNPSFNARKKHCPAYGKKCDHCGIPNHLTTVCRSKTQPPRRVHEKSSPIDNSSETNNECPIWQELCSVHNQEESSNAFLSHHIYRNGSWIQKPSQPQPSVLLMAATSADDYKQLGIKLPIKPKQANVMVLPDTGCQSCLAGYNFVKRLGLEDHLIKVNLKMTAANKSTINILGAVVVRFSGKDNSGADVETRQMVYITDTADRVFLSREACQELGLIPSNFPILGDTCDAINGKTDLENKTTVDSRNVAECGCPKRELPPPIPESMPFKVTCAEDVKFLQDWLLKYYRASTFNTCTHQPLPRMHGPPLRLMIDPDAKPVANHTPIPIPLHWLEQVKADIDRDVRLGLIEPVPIGDKVVWCHRMVVCAKKNGKPRRTVDLQALNKFAARETHHTQSPYIQARSVPSDKLKTVFDCWNGYHSISLHEDDYHYTTFITPWGRYRYKVAPQGYIASGDGYCRRFDEIVADIPNKTKCIDDTLLWADTYEESFKQAANWLDVCGRNGITLNPEKFVFARHELEFAGFTITDKTVKPSAKYISAIRDFPTPTNLTDVRSWFGLVNQVAYAFAAAKVMEPFRKLLKSDVKFYWDEQLEEVFQNSKSVIISQIEHGVQIFQKSRPTCLATDWSKTGIGYWLLQKHCNCEPLKPFCCHTGWKVTLVGSRFTSTAESRYAPIEGEALAVVYGLEHARHFVLGCNDLVIAVDHKPLLNVFGSRSLDIPNNRIRNLKEKTLRYRFSMTYIPGIKHKATDAISRNPVGPLNPPKLQLRDDDDDTSTMMISTIKTTTHHSSHTKSALTDLLSTMSIQSQNSDDSVTVIAALDSLQAITWNKIRLATSSDEDMESLLTYVESGFPTCKSELPGAVQAFFQHKNHLTSTNGVILYKKRIVVPTSLRQTVLSLLHCAHQGVSRMVARAEASVFWPGITVDIQNTRKMCSACNQMAPSQPHAPPTEIKHPSYPFQMICSDFFAYRGKHYLIVVDRYSNWLTVERARDGSKGLVDCLRRTFSTFGIPDELTSDGGLEFTSEFTQKFLKDWGVNHRVSSVAFPHSNCRAEIGVKSARRIITDNTDCYGNLDVDAFQRAALNHRNTPSPDSGISPAQCIFGRPIKDFIPIPRDQYKPHHTWSDTLDRREEALRNRHQRMQEKWTEHTKALPPLKVGDLVRVQNQLGNAPRKWDKTGTVVEVRQHDQYVVKIDGSNRATLRNRKFLRKYEPMFPIKPRATLSDRLKNMPEPRLVDQKKSNDHAQEAPKVVADDQGGEVEPQMPTLNSRTPKKDDDDAGHAKRPTMNNQTPKVPLALRRLANFNNTGLTEN